MFVLWKSLSVKEGMKKKKLFTTRKLVSLLTYIYTAITQIDLS